MFGGAVWKGCGSFVLLSLTRRGKAGLGQNLKILSILLPAQGFCLLVHIDGITTSSPTAIYGGAWLLCLPNTMNGVL